MLVHRSVTPSIKFAGTHLCTWVERGTVGVKCLAQEHNTMSPARARTRTARSGVELTNHEPTAPPNKSIGWDLNCTPKITYGWSRRRKIINELPINDQLMCIASVEGSKFGYAPRIAFTQTSSFLFLILFTVFIRR